MTDDNKNLAGKMRRTIVSCPKCGKPNRAFMTTEVGEGEDAKEKYGDQALVCGDCTHEYTVSEGNVSTENWPDDKKEGGSENEGEDEAEGAEESDDSGEEESEEGESEGDEDSEDSVEEDDGFDDGL